MDNQYVIKSKYPDIEPVENKTFPEFIWEQVERNSHWKNEEFLISGTTGKSYTYQEIHDLSKGFAAGLKVKLGLNDNDIVGVLLPNCPEFMVVFFGILDAGCVAALMNPAYKILELKHLAKIVDMKCVVTLESFSPVVLQLKVNTSLEHIVTLDGTHPECTNIQELIRTDFSNVSLLKGLEMDARERVAAILFSSGTTGLPKGVMLTHCNLATNIRQLLSKDEIFPLSTYSLNGRQERVLAVLPFFHVYGIVIVGMCTMYRGGQIVTIPKFEPKSFIDAFRKIKPTVAFLVPPLASFIVNAPEFTSQEFEETHSIVCGAAPLGTALITKLMEKIVKDVNILEGYGMTELSPLSHFTPFSPKNFKIGTVGLLLPNTWAKVVDLTTGKTLGPNQPGELWIKGPQVMKGYFKNEVETKNTIDADGYLHTGDIVKYDTDGFFYIEDRLKEIIKCKGFQISPSELENIIRLNPKVADVAVIGVESEAGESPRAYVVKKDSSLTEKEVFDWVDERVARFKRLTGGTEFVDAIPKSAAGKILRKDLLNAYKEKIQASQVKGA